MSLGSKAPVVFVCICNGLTERRIRAAAEEGARTHEEVYTRCGCVAQCYACAAEVDAIIALATPKSEAPPSPAAGSFRGPAT